VYSSSYEPRVKEEDSKVDGTSIIIIAAPLCTVNKTLDRPSPLDGEIWAVTRAPALPCGLSRLLCRLLVHAAPRLDEEVGHELCLGAGRVDAGSARSPPPRGPQHVVVYEEAAAARARRVGGTALRARGTGRGPLTSRTRASCRAQPRPRQP